MYNNTDTAGCTADSTSGSTDTGTDDGVVSAGDQHATTDETDGDLSASTFGIEGIEDAEDAAEADLGDRVADRWGCSL